MQARLLSHYWNTLRNRCNVANEVAKDGANLLLNRFLTWGQLIGVIAAMVGPVVLWGWSAENRLQVFSVQAQTRENRIASLETQLRQAENLLSDVRRDLAEIRADMRWLRERLGGK